jgi:hypothetical protein
VLELGAGAAPQNGALAGNVIVAANAFDDDSLLSLFHQNGTTSEE